MLLYTISSGILFLFMSITWNSKDWPNTFVKFCLYSMTGWSFFLVCKVL